MKESNYISIADDEKFRNPEINDERYLYLLKAEIKDLKKTCDLLKAERTKYFSLCTSLAFDKQDLTKELDYLRMELAKITDET